MVAESNTTSHGISNTILNQKPWYTKPKVNLQSSGAHVASYYNPIDPGSLSQRLALGNVDPPKGC